jgi:hypothetical protein
MSAPRLIAIDMDGTLLHSDGHVSERNLAAIRDAEARDVEVAIATGRRHCYAMRVLRELDRPAHTALISSNGTVIRTLGSELLHRSYMPVETARWLCEHAREFRGTMVITFDKVLANGEDERGALVCEGMDELNASISRWMEVNEPYIAQVSPIELALENASPIQMMVCGSVDRMREAEAHLLSDARITNADDDCGLASKNAGVEIVLHRTEYPQRDLCILDILPAGCSKASALLHLAELRGIDSGEILAIGDNWNDVPMFQVAGHAAVMANAPEDLRALATKRGWLIAPSNDEDGVASVIEAAIVGDLAVER